MKKVVVLFLLGSLAFGSDKMTTSEHLYFHANSNKASSKKSKQRKIDKIKKISKQKVKSIVKNITGDDIKYIKLFHRGKILKYFVKTSHDRVVILNAINGEVIYKK